MAGKIVAIVGSYRKGGVTDSAVSAALEAAQSLGVKTSIVYLTDKHIEFCTNCRSCTQAAGTARGRCIQNDDMDSILMEVEASDGLILAAPINFFNVTAVMRKFIERLVCYSYWPWDMNTYPRYRQPSTARRAVVITSSACPPYAGRILMPGALSILKTSAKCMGARVIKSLFFGVNYNDKQFRLSDRDIQKARLAGEKLALSIEQRI